MEQSPHQLSPDRTIIITVCVGSSCHLKGAYEILAYLKQAIRSNGFEQRVTLKGSFCMERCTEGVNIKIDEELFSVVSLDDMKEIFETKVLHTLNN